MDNEKFNLHESTIDRDTLLITGAESGVERRVPKILLECSTRQFHNEIIASPDDGGLLGSRNANKNDVIISDTTLHSFSPPQLLSMTDKKKKYVVVPFVTVQTIFKNC